MLSRKSSRPVHAAVFLLLATLSAFGCDSDPAPEENLEGTYDLVALTDKTGELTGSNVRYDAGSQQTIQVTRNGQTFPATVSVSGRLILNESNYTFTLEIRINGTGEGSNYTEQIDLGESNSWSTSNSRITFAGSAESLGTMDYLLDGDRLLLENLDIRLNLER